ncbi:acyl-CoA thioesterase-1 [Salinimicrobium sediminis]|uniref:Acyl-CoA thioesterase-1 n=1 Tax=Salinimicrobium sediminis TaxID=1343891 RepID=A0A285X6Y6_9FLAO|nr:arylesterase [Salinimicrobium sediminis]SOC81090.1 acyl-CoA thioesterase-1 [Salinimicrobium sediminis]
MRNLVYLSFLTLLLFSSCGEASKNETNAEIEAEESEETEKDTSKDTKTILFFGDSLTAAMGLDPAEGFPAEIQQKIDSIGLNYEVVDAGLSGETTAGGRNRIQWVLNQKVDVFVLELGANDGLRGIPVQETRQNLQAIIDIVRAKNPNVEIILAGMQVPPNLGQDYTEEFKNVFPELAQENDLHLIPFLLEGVAGNPSLNQQDRIHPTEEGYDIVAENVWTVLEPVISDQ